MLQKAAARTGAYWSVLRGRFAAPQDEDVGMKCAELQNRDPSRADRAAVEFGVWMASELGPSSRVTTSNLRGAGQGEGGPLCT
jgi:hypothetical protein